MLSAMTVSPFAGLFYFEKSKNYRTTKNLHCGKEFRLHARTALLQHLFYFILHVRTTVKSFDARFESSETCTTWTLRPRVYLCARDSAKHKKAMKSYIRLC